VKEVEGYEKLWIKTVEMLQKTVKFDPSTILNGDKKEKANKIDKIKK